MQRDEIDLKKYILAIIQGWKLLIILAVLGAGVAYLIIKLQTPYYSSSSSLYVGIPSSYMVFDERMGSTIATASTRTIDYKAMLDIASSRELLQIAWEKSTVSSPMTLELFRSNANAVNGSSPANIKFTVTLEDGQAAATLANAWAEAAAERLNAIAIGTDQETLASFEAEKGKAEQAILDTASALSAFEQENHVTFLEQDLQAMLERRESLLRANAQEVPDREIQLKDAEKKILSAQQDLTALKARKALLEADYDRAVQTYAILNAKLDETRVAVAVGNSFAQVTDHAQASKTPNQQEWKTVTGLSAAAGFLLGVLIIILQIWWKEDQSNSALRA